jgi:hypothetical protein
MQVYKLMIFGALIQLSIYQFYGFKNNYQVSIIICSYLYRLPFLEISHEWNHITRGLI